MHHGAHHGWQIGFQIFLQVPSTKAGGGELGQACMAPEDGLSTVVGDHLLMQSSPPSMQHTFFDINLLPVLLQKIKEGGEPGQAWAQQVVSLGGDHLLHATRALLPPRRNILNINLSHPTAKVEGRRPSSILCPRSCGETIFCTPHKLSSLPPPRNKKHGRRLSTWSGREE